MKFSALLCVGLFTLCIFLTPPLAYSLEQGPPPRVSFTGEIGYDARNIRSHVDMLALQRESIDHQKASFNLRIYLENPRMVYPTPLIQLSGGFGVAGRGSADTGRGFVWDTSAAAGIHLRLNKQIYVTPLAGVQIQEQQYDRAGGRREMAWKGMWVGLEGTLDGIPPWEVTIGAQGHWSSLDHDEGTTELSAGRFTGLVLSSTAGYRITKHTGLSLKYQRGRWETHGSNRPQLDLDSELVAANLNILY